jgi:hypothetical protein
MVGLLRILYELWPESVKKLDSKRMGKITGASQINPDFAIECTHTSGGLKHKFQSDHGIVFK